MENMNAYLGLFIINPEKEDSVGDVQNSIKAIIKDSSGEIVKENVIGKKALAYPVRKRSEGIYYEVTFKLDPKKVSYVQRQCEINTDILRTMINRGK